MDAEQTPKEPLSAAAWGRLASISRTLTWASTQPESHRSAADLGVNCGRLVDEVLTELESPSDVFDAVSKTKALLEAMSQTSEEDFPELTEAVLRAVHAVVPPSQLGAQLPLTMVKSELVIPSKRKGSKKKSKNKDAQNVDNGSTADASASPSPEQDATPSPPAETTPQKSAAAKPSVAQKQKPPEKKKPPPLLALHHPDGGGRPLSALRNADAQVVDVLKGAGIHTIADLLQYPPKRHVRPPVGVLPPQGDEVCILRAVVLSRCLRLNPMGRRWEVTLQTGNDMQLVCRWIRQAPRGWLRWASGQTIALMGSVEQAEDGVFLMYEAEPVGVFGQGSGLMPEYDIADIEPSHMRDLVSEALESIEQGLEERLPDKLIEQQRLLPLGEALKDAHFPANSAGRGRVRLAFEELLQLQIGVAWKSGQGSPERGIPHTLQHSSIAQLCWEHNISLDDGQELVFSEIRRDLARSTPMTRLLQGDVGTGKGLVTLLTAALVAENRLQVLMIGPDPLAVERRYLFAENLLRSINIVPILVGDSLSHGQLDAIRRGEVHVVFGTHRLLSKDVHWRRLGLVICEERGEYGTVTPAMLPEGKGPRPDLLVTTAAPIPTTLAFSVFGEFDVSVVPTKQTSRATGMVFHADERSMAYSAARDLVQAGRQAYVVFPVRDGQDLLGVDDALRVAKALQSEAFPDQRIGIYCSGMSREERFRVFDDFQHRRIDVLVCTTFIEEAPTLDNATVVIVEHADLHDMVRLHRLRGHISRSPRPGNALYILSDEPDERARQHIEQVIREDDGFRLAELDLQERGSRALLGERAQEVPEFVWADPPRDRHLLLQARAEAFALIRQSQQLRRWPTLLAAIAQRWGAWFGDDLPTPTQEPAGSNRRRRRRRRRRK